MRVIIQRVYQHIYTYDAVRHEFCGLTRTGSDEGLCIFSPVVLGDQAGVVRGWKGDRDWLFVCNDSGWKYSSDIPGVLIKFCSTCR